MKEERNPLSFFSVHSKFNINETSTYSSFHVLALPEDIFPQGIEVQEDIKEIIAQG